MTENWLLDLFCGAGGCAKGYQRAGFRVRGVDHKLMPRYIGEEFVQADAMEYLQSLIKSGEIAEFDAIHASPPCQDYSPLKSVTRKLYPRLIDATRSLCEESGMIYVIENVEGAPLANLPLFGTHSITLCGTMFPGLRVYRHRRFESNINLLAPPHPRHMVSTAKQGRPPEFDGQFVTVTGSCSGADYARRAMGIDWMSLSTLSQAIPPAYTEFIGRQLMENFR